jgi:hypothetical protein
VFLWQNMNSDIVYGASFKLNMFQETELLSEL